MRDIEQISGDVIDVALRLHRALGPGLLERGYLVARQRPIDVEFDGLRFEAAFHIDLLVEIKSVERLMPVHGKQLLTYLRLANQPVGLLINFGCETLKEGLKRIVNDYRPSAPPLLRVNQKGIG